VIYSDGSSGLKFIRYHDLLAIVTMGMQGIDLTVANIEQKVSDVNTKIASDFGLLSPRVRVFEDALVELLKSSLGDHATGNGEGSETYHLRDGGTLTDLAGNMSAISRLNLNFASDHIDTKLPGESGDNINIAIRPNISNLDAYLVSSKPTVLTKGKNMNVDSEDEQTYTEDLISELYSLVDK